MRSTEYTIGKDNQIIENKNYVDPKVKKVNFPEHGTLGISESEHKLGTGVSPSDPISPAGEGDKKPEKQKEEVNREFIEKVKREKKDSAEIKDSRTKEYTADDGTKILEISAIDKYKEVNGKYQEIDLKPKKDKDNNLVNTSEDLSVKYSAKLSDGITVTTPEGELKFSPKDINTSEAETTENKVTYKNAWDGVDLVYEYYEDSVKEYIILNKQIENPVFEFKVDGAELAYSEEVKGGIEVKLSNGSILINPLSVATQRMGPLGSDMIKQEITEEGGLKATLDIEWLKSLEEEEFPVVIDPTIQRYIQNNYTLYHAYKHNVFDCNSSSCDVNIGAVQHDNASWNWRSRVKFDLAALNGKQILDANLHVQKSNNSRPSGGFTNVQVNAAWANCFGFNCIGGSPVASTTMNTYGNLNITSLLNWMGNNNMLTNEWLILWGQEINDYTFKGLDPYQMIVDVLYNNIPNNNATPAYPTDAQIVKNLNQVLRINPATDPDNDTLRYNFVLSNSSGHIIQQSGWSSSLSMPIADGVLQDDQTYTWQVFVADNTYSHSTPAFIKTFIVDSRTGKDPTQSYDKAGPFNVSLATGNAYTTNGSHSMSALGGNIAIGLEYNSPFITREGLSAKYYNNNNWNGSPVYNRIDPNIDYNWGTASPFKGLVNEDLFSVSWSGYYIAPVDGAYKFGANADDSVWVYGGGNLLFNVGCCGETWSSTVNLTAGQVWPIQIDYIEGGGPGHIQLKVELPGGIQKIVPVESLRTDALPRSSSNGLTGKYYFDDGTHNYNTNLSRFLMRNEPVIDFDWGNGSPFVGAPSDNFLVKYEGYVTAPITGDYTFAVEADDGVEVIVDGVSVITQWTNGNHTLTSPTPKTLQANTSYKIMIKYYEVSAGAKLRLKWDGPNTIGTEQVIIENKFLSPEANVLPVGWKLTLDANGNIPFESLKVRANGDVAMITSDGTESLYKYNGSTTNGGYTPPVNEDGWLLKNDNNTYTFTDTVGTTYIYDVVDNSGEYKLKESSSPYDDKNPAGLKYEYSDVGGTHKLRKIIDGVDSTRYGQLYYQGDSECTPASGLNVIPAGYLCAFATTDGNWTRFNYYEGKLTRIVYTGTSAYFDYGYDSNGRILALRDTSMIDAVEAGLRDYNETGSRYAFHYDILGRMQKIDFPSSTGASDLQHELKYFPGSSKQSIVGTTEPHGYSKYLEFDSLYRTTRLCDVMALCTLTEWDTQKDLILSTTTPTGLKSTTIYDGDDRPLENYGPAPATWFGSDRKPLSQYLSQVPKVETKYDETFVGGAVAFYQVSGKNLFGSPKLHQFGIVKTAPSVIGFNYATQTFPIAKASGMDGVGLSMSGKLTFPQNGIYTFKSLHTDAIKVYVNDTLIADNWDNRSANPTEKTGIFTAVAGTVYRVRVDWATYNTTPSLSVLLSGPGISESNVWANLKPGYKLPTTNIVYDQQLGNIESKTNYQDPAYGLVSSQVLDPSGLNYSSAATYEPQGTGYFRQLSKTSPGGSLTTYNYYGANEQVDNVCTANNDSVSQAGFLRSKVEPAPELQAPNLIANPTVDIATGNSPTEWNTDNWGNNTPTFEYSTSGYNSSRSLKISLSNFVDGDAKWTHKPVEVTPGKVYTFKDHYKSTTNSKIVLQYKIAGNYSYTYVGNYATVANWTLMQFNFTVPAGATQVVVFHLIDSNGSLWTDNFSLTKAANTNVIPNPSVETANGSVPQSWTNDSWGNNSTTFQYLTSGYEGSKSIKISMSSYVDGDAKWSHTPVVVKPGITYTFSDAYKSNVQTDLIARYTIGVNTYSYVYLTTLPASNTWTTISVNTEAPSNATHLTMLHLLDSVGELTLDSYSITEFGQDLQSGQKSEVIYDASGRVVADRINLENWNCTTYDSRGRVQNKVIANNNSKVGKTITNNYSYGGSPLKRLTTDGSSTVITEYDYIGNLIKYTDNYGAVTTYTYDSQNRLIKKESDAGKEEWAYNSYSQVTSKEFNDVVYANVTYDSFGRVSGITYPQAQQLAFLGTTRDALDRPTKYSWRQSDGVLIDEELTKSQSGLILAQKFTQNGTIYNQQYTFDKADRLLSADYGDRQYAYNYGTPTNCSFQSSNKNFNRTSDSITVAGVTTTNSYCYDNADRLKLSSQFGAPTYDFRGNTTQLGGVTLGYDVLDQNISVSETGKSITYTRDVLGRIVNSNYNSGSEVKKYNFTSNSSSPDILRDANNNIVERYISLPGLRLTIKSSGNEYSIMTSTGNVLAINTGTLKRYDPFGTQIGGTDTLGFGGSQLRESDYRFAVDFVQMGARIYIPVLGRFLQVDPVEGGNLNDYIYPLNPISTNDFSGKFLEEVGVFLNDNRETISATLSFGATAIAAVWCGASIICGVITGGTIAAAGYIGSYAGTDKFSASGMLGVTLIGGGISGFATAGSNLINRFISKSLVPLVAESAELGVNSRALGNYSIVSPLGTNTKTAGVLNQPSNWFLRVGWGVTVNSSGGGAAVLRVSLPSAGVHIDIFRGLYQPKGAKLLF